MDCKGVIFDFNGTLFWDSEKHEIAWKEFSKEIRGVELNEEEFKTKVHGRTNELILKYIIGEDCDKDKIDKLSKEKERVYRELCKKDKENFRLVPGANEFFDYLKERGIPFTIATASIKENVDFFVESFNLNRWFDINKIAFDDGNTRSKPDPDIYLKAADLLGVNIKDCIVFEDAISGIKSANNAGVKEIIVIDGIGEKETFKDIVGVSKIIKDFRELL
ncbi:HAD family phosphatase [Clostridium sp. LIBA-8841]|uniref:HAD family hydrolase n=1 Tax=Clostridium sp. LIBA-8841 TaxID=2987530 RepID=UPI002AC5DC5F|nr:HAD family phosphatase [Clostridium sp. LIBA-8841]MDZ5252098.1 HAD family phosphatase [Clostridium sp. LIBA-8841]